MYDIEDYYDIEYRNKPYQSALEELGDWQRLLDMLLEGYLEQKKRGSERKLFSRGLVITEAEMESYFSTPPLLRELDTYDPVSAVAARVAVEYITNRTAITLGLPDADSYWANAAQPGNAGMNNRDRSQQDQSGEDTAGEEWTAELGILWIHTLRQIFDLDMSGVIAVILAVASATDRRYERIFGYLQDDISRTKPTIGLLNALMSRITSREETGELLPGMLDEELFNSLFVGTEEDLNLGTELVLNPLLKRILMGQTENEMKLPPALTLYREDMDIPVFFDDSAAQLHRILSDPSQAYCFIESEDEDTVLHLLNCLSMDADEPLYILDLKQLLGMSRKEQLHCIGDLSMRLRLGNGLLAVRYETEEDRGNGENRDQDSGRWRMLERIYLTYQSGCMVLFGGKEEPGELIVKSVPFLRIPQPDADLRLKIWSYFLTEEDETEVEEDVVIEDLANCHDISYSMIRNTVNYAKSTVRVEQRGKISRSVLLESLRQLGQVDFKELASYVRASYTWDDITISEDQRVILKLACDRYRLRSRVGEKGGLTKKNAYGNGVSLLLYGPPGTGKTMAAQVISNELGIPLYKVDVSQIFSKYVGETEKNLSVIFNAAKGSNVILFFDEADSLFSRRTEISSSNDKYSNSETAFLLQKIEEYDGMSILATNLYANFDIAFVRRITYAVRLDNPGEEERYALWTSILPVETKRDQDIPFRFLAEKFELSGANIKAILYGAAYMAGAEGKPVGTRHIIRCLEYEYKKLGRFINRESFGPYGKYLSSQGRSLQL